VAAAIAVDQEEQRLVRLDAHRASQLLHGVYRLTIYFQNHIARLDTRLRRTALGIDILHEQAADVGVVLPEAVAAAIRVRRDRADSEAERRPAGVAGRILFRWAAAAPWTFSVRRLAERDVDRLFAAVA